MSLVRWIALSCFLACSAYLGWFYLVTNSHHSLYFTALADAPCLHPLEGVQFGSPIMSESETRRMDVFLSQAGVRAMHYPGSLEANRKNLQPCNAELEILAPAFDYSPSAEKATVKLPASYARRTYTVLVTPKRRGEHLIIVKTGFDQVRVPVRVTTDLGLTAVQSAWAAAVGCAVSFVVALLTIRGTWPAHRTRGRKR